MLGQRWNRLLRLAVGDYKANLQNVLTCRPKYQLGQQTFLSTTTTMPCKAVQDGNQKDGDKKKLKVMFFGTDEFALECLKKLHEQKASNAIDCLDVCYYKMKRLVPAVTKYSEDENLNIHLWPPNIEQDEFDVGVVASFGHLIPSKIISQFRLGMINVHGSLLPKLRGGAPIIHAIKAGDTSTGITIFKIKPKRFDVGDILAQREVVILPDETRPQLTHKMAVTGAELMGEVVEDLEQYIANAVPQSEVGVSQAPVIDKGYAFIDFQTQTSHEIYNQWRAVGDLMKLRTAWKPNGSTVRFGTVLPPWVLTDMQLDAAHPLAVPGQPVFLKLPDKRKFLCIKCRQGWVAVEDIYMAKRKVMKPLDFKNGFLGVNRDNSNKAARTNKKNDNQDSLCDVGDKSEAGNDIKSDGDNHYIFVKDS